MVLLGQTTTTTSTPVSSPSPITHLSSSDWIIALALTVGLVIVAGIVIAVSRSWLEGRPGKAEAANHAGAGAARTPDRTLIRSWLAISLAGGLLLFCAISFGLDDTTLRSTLIGGLVANAGAAVAFYFASRASDQARHDILTASFPSVVVPNLIGKTERDVNAAMATTSLHLLAQPADRDKNAATVVSQNPAANQAVPQSSQISVEFAGPVPDVVGPPAMTPPQAAAALTERNLLLVKDPPDAGDDKTAKSQYPLPQSDAPQDKNVKVTFG